MLGLPLTFAAPLVLAALAALPAIWWLLRVTPPQPRRIDFPPLRILADLLPQRETPARTPWWLLALRLALAALLILAAAGPIWNPAAGGGGRGPLLLVVDNGFTAAHDWRERSAFAIERTEAAGRDGRAVALIGTAERPGALQAAAPADSARAVAGAETSAASGRSARPSARHRGFPEGERRRRDRLDQRRRRRRRGRRLHAGPRARRGRRLRHRSSRPIAPPRSRSPESTTPPASFACGSCAPRRTAATRHGPGARSQEPAARRRALRLRGRRDGDGGALRPADRGAQRHRPDRDPRGGLGRRRGPRGRARQAPPGRPRCSAAPPTRRSPFSRRPTTSPGRSAPTPRCARAAARSRRRSRTTSTSRSRCWCSPMSGALDRETLGRVTQFVEGGGLLLRFAGSRLAGGNDELVPVRLRRGGRNLGGTLSWDTPKTLSPFTRESPFFGLDVPADLGVRRQILAEPDGDLADEDLGLAAGRDADRHGGQARRGPDGAVPRHRRHDLVEPAALGPVRRHAPPRRGARRRAGRHRGRGPQRRRRRRSRRASPSTASAPTSRRPRPPAPSPAPSRSAPATSTRRASTARSTAASPSTRCRGRPAERLELRAAERPRRSPRRGAHPRPPRAAPSLAAVALFLLDTLISLWLSGHLANLGRRVRRGRRGDGDRRHGSAIAASGAPAPSSRRRPADRQGDRRPRRSSRGSPT